LEEMGTMGTMASEYIMYLKVKVLVVAARKMEKLEGQ
jgi:hypothetical protein